MSNWNFTMGRCFGTPVTVHWTFLLVLLFQVIFTLISYSSSWKYILVMVVAYGPVLLSIVLLHELGHVWRTRKFGGHVNGDMMLWPLGGMTDLKIPDGTCLQEFWVSLCGPLMHIPQIFVWLGIMALCHSVDYFGAGFDVKTFDDGGADLFFAELSKQALLLNIMLFAANLLIPAYPMDAARLLASLSVHFGFSITQAAYVILGACCVVGLIGLVLGILYLVQKTGPGFLLFFLGLYCLYNGYTLYKSIQEGSHFHHPVFAPDCYKNQRAGGNSSAAQPAGAANRQAPAQQQKEKQPAKPKGKKSNAKQKYSRDEETGDASPYAESVAEKSPAPPGAAAKKKKVPTKKKQATTADGDKKPAAKKKTPVKKVPATKL